MLNILVKMCLTKDRGAVKSQVRMVIEKSDLSSEHEVAVEKLAIAVFALAALSVAIPVASRDFMVVFIAFLGVELAVGMFFPCGGTLRSRSAVDKCVKIRW